MSIYDFQVRSIDGDELSLEKYRNKVLLIVNTATQCGFTTQYEGLQKLYEDYSNQGFEILDFPCNQFGAQTPESEPEIQNFCRNTYNIGFTQFAKICVNGSEEAPLYKFLKSQKSGFFGDAIKWNFTKFLINREGEVTARFSPMDKPEKLRSQIEQLL